MQVDLGPRVVIASDSARFVGGASSVRVEVILRLVAEVLLEELRTHYYRREEFTCPNSIYDSNFSS